MLTGPKKRIRKITNRSVYRVAAQLKISDRTTADYDFGLVKLERKISWKHYPHMRPVCLPADDKETYEGRNAIVSGWGVTESTPLSATLQEAEVGVINNKVKQYAVLKISL